ncbi:MAG: flavin reductase family protein, partial [Rhodobacteraceae bacterium]|nr:flavin reductase family protein [Paracoccaceae bacterium]
LSLDPPLVSIALMCRSGLLAGLRESRRFAINLLAEDQADLALRFAAPGAERFEGIDWHLHRGLPRLAGVARYLDCTLHTEVAGGDHALIFGRVTDCWMSDTPPLIHAARRFGTHSGLVRLRTGQARLARRIDDLYYGEASGRPDGGGVPQPGGGPAGVSTTRA